MRTDRISRRRIDPAASFCACGAANDVVRHRTRRDDARGCGVNVLHLATHVDLGGITRYIETLSRARPRFDETMLRARLGAVGFSGDKADTKIANLSGGERARLMLAMATLDRPNLLILDEPTNHLDIDARDELLEALNEFEGAVVLISHDRRLVEGVVDRLVLVAAGGANPFDGDIEEYKRIVLSQSSPKMSGNRSAGASKADQRREAAEQRERMKPLRNAMEKAERDMALLQSRLEELDRALAEPNLFIDDPAKGEALSKRRAETALSIADAEARWIEAAETFEKAKTTL